MGRPEREKEGGVLLGYSINSANALKKLGYEKTYLGNEEKPNLFQT